VVTTTTLNSCSPILTERAAHVALARYHEAVKTGRRIKLARESAELSRAELAAYVLLSETTLARVERGERTVSGRERAAIARGLGVSIGFLSAANGNGRSAA
jgi:ribosome-binding protein aMBF1 (putative translation factor)